MDLCFLRGVQFRSDYRIRPYMNVNIWSVIGGPFQDIWAFSNAYGTFVNGMRVSRQS